jgi:L-lysine 2,3-aminomutase
MIMVEPTKYQAFSVHNFRKIPQVQEYLTEEECFEIEVVGKVLPFKVNNYVVDCLINWDNFRDDPMFILTFPQKEMLEEDDFEKVAAAVKAKVSKPELQKIVNQIRLDLNPHPAGQMSKNVPTMDGQRLTGIQHKYRETALFFPKQGQTCHAYCTFCFRWPQFVGMDEMKFAMKETELLVEYLHRHPEITDVLFTGGRPCHHARKNLERLYTSHPRPGAKCEKYQDWNKSTGLLATTVCNR